MIGPCKAGTWTVSNNKKSFAHLKPNAVYRVNKEFTDFDGVIHLLGERWTFLGYNFSHYYDGLSLFVSIDGKNEWHIRLNCDESEQGPIVHQLDLYLVLDDR